ncbi:rapsyn-related [Anaeramoeba flamelloides]|uniref:Tetratricopeptide repeat protein 29 n=1 Tax=Anaeramoeba flamelloides TaxID=1746091 RepID=A0ABQ8XF01_9EUKA|nr:rapsyn-related [Anaeramoeba flamelloides]
MLSFTNKISTFSNNFFQIKIVNPQNLINVHKKKIYVSQNRVPNFTARVPSVPFRNFITASTNKGKEDPSWKDLDKQGEQLLQKGDRKNACKVFELALMKARESCNVGQEIETLNKLSITYYAIVKDFNLAAKYAREWADLSTKITHDESLSDSLSVLIFSYARLGKRELLQKELSRFKLLLVEQQKDEELKRFMMRKLGALYKSVGEYEKSTQQLESALKLFDQKMPLSQNQPQQSKKNYSKENPTEEEIDLLQDLYKLYLKVGKLNEAIEIGKRQVKCLEKAGKITDLLSTLMNLGYLTKAMTKVSLSIEFYHQAETIAQENESQQDLIIIKTALGELHAIVSDLNESRVELEKAIELSREIKNNTQLIRTTEILANILFSYKLWGEAIDKFQNVLQLSEKLKVYCSKDLNNLNLAKCLIEVKKYTEAKSHLDKSLKIIKQSRRDINAKWARLLGRKIKAKERILSKTLLQEYPNFTKEQNKQAQQLEHSISRLDTLQYNCYMSLITAHDKTSQYAEALSIGDQAIELVEIAPVDHTCVCDDDESKNEHTAKTKIGILNQLQEIAVRSKNWAKSEELITQNLELLKQFRPDDHNTRIETLNLLSSVFLSQNQFQKACSCLNQVIDLACATQDTISQTIALILLGKSLLKLNRKDEAYKSFLSARKFFKTLDSKGKNELNVSLQGQEFDITILDFLDKKLDQLKEFKKRGKNYY